MEGADVTVVDVGEVVGQDDVVTCQGVAAVRYLLVMCLIKI